VTVGEEFGLRSGKGVPRVTAALLPQPFALLKPAVPEVPARDIERVSAGDLLECVDEVLVDEIGNGSKAIEGDCRDRSGPARRDSYSVNQREASLAW